MIQRLDLYQKMLHHKKLFLLEHGTSKNDADTVIKSLLDDIQNKLNEIIDSLNGSLVTEPAITRVVPKAPQRHTEAEREALERFVNSGETCLSVSAQNVLGRSTQLLGFDVVLLKCIDINTNLPFVAADRAIELAGSRAIIGVDKSLQDKMSMYLARVRYHWEHYEFEAVGNEMAYYIIDKREGQQTLAP